MLPETGVPALLVTHDFTEAALLGDRVGVIDGGRVVQEGTAAELAASPASAFVADFTGAVVLTGTARAGAGGLTARRARRRRHRRQHRARRGPGRGQRLPVGDRARARRAPSAAARPRTTSPSRVVSVTAVGNRVRVGLAAPQPLTAEITDASVHELDLAPGAAVVATWKAAATRLLRLVARRRRACAGVPGVLAAAEQHDREHGGEHRDVLDHHRRVAVLDEPAPEQRDGGEAGEEHRRGHLPRGRPAVAAIAHPGDHRHGHDERHPEQLELDGVMSKPSAASGMPRTTMPANIATSIST